MTKTERMPGAPLKSANMEKFAQEVANGASQAEAYRRAYSAGNMTDQTVYNQGHKLMKRPDISVRVSELRQVVTEAWVFDRAEAIRLVLEDARDVLLADPSELTTYRRLNCRHCHGMNFAYRWKDEREFWAALEVAAAAQEDWENAAPDRRQRKRPELPVDDGGYGFRKLHPPHPHCPECEGEGIEDVRIADIRTLKGPARRLFNGVKQTKNGLEILQRNRESARELLAKHTGLISDQLKVSGVLGVTPLPLTDEVRAAILKAIENDI